MNKEVNSKKRKWRKSLKKNNAKFDKETVLNLLLNIDDKSEDAMVQYHIICEQGMNYSKGQLSESTKQKQKKTNTKKETDESMDCVICMDDLYSKELYLCSKCNSATAHQSCVLKWHQKQRITDNRCPLCNT